jgi:hypothetical protein
VLERHDDAVDAACSSPSQLARLSVIGRWPALRCHDHGRGSRAIDAIASSSGAIRGSANERERFAALNEVVASWVAFRAGAAATEGNCDSRCDGAGAGGAGVAAGTGFCRGGAAATAAAASRAGCGEASIRSALGALAVVAFDAGARVPSARRESKLSSNGRSHHIKPTTVATITLAKPAATGGRASHAQAAAHGLRATTDVPAGNGSRAVARACRRIASVNVDGGVALASGA